MAVISKKRTKLAKVALTQKLEETEKQIIVSHGQAKPTHLAEGNFLSYQYDEQVFIHGGHCTELVDSHIVSTAHSALLITILLEGTLSFGYGDLQFDLSAKNGPQGVVVNIAKPANFYRSLSRNNQMCKVNILIKPKWLQSRMNGNDRGNLFLDIHQAFYRLELHQPLIDLVNTLAHRESPKILKDKVEIESLTSQILAYVLAQLPEDCDKGNSTAVDTPDARIEDVISYIETHLDHPLTLDKLAKKFSMSVSNLQRRFKQALNITVNEYIRHRRLAIARQHLERGLVTITEAAYEAGYQHPSNFTNAFKKLFGVPPQAIEKIN
ncbi:helix-turn-helix transcriptional regulator [Vibrio sp. 404]|uniref:Helix-turn-helix transcriptional regulator n=1 Tax=Vibrio marinisediminis TaxID=2758441 RepID=A0A7W2FS97_9VIBR|nr:AraC family transcriptional regulator [Vibrio marinisediminis]MBA5763272.1 helix-turn-helix transcriptional regulator [Vibrio marinisediminis]